MADRGIGFLERDVSSDEKAAKEMLKLLQGRMMTPSIVVGKEVLMGFAQNRARMEALFPKKSEEV